MIWEGGSVIDRNAIESYDRFFTGRPSVTLATHEVGIGAWQKATVVSTKRTRDGVRLMLWYGTTFRVWKLKLEGAIPIRGGSPVK